MKISYLLPEKIGKLMSVTFLLIFLSSYVTSVYAQTNDSFIEINGQVVNITTGEPIIAASIQEVNSNVSTITNTEGSFLLKLNTTKTIILKIDALGYKPKTIIVSRDNEEDLRITLQTSTIELTEVSITSYKNARDLVNKVFENKRSNYLEDKTLMTTFYRETIKKRNKNASLAEAVLNVYKQPYGDSKKDVIKLVKSRKNTDYSKLDTIALKLQGGPFSALYIDLMKYPEYVFTPYTMEGYEFEFGPASEINGTPVYTVHFKQKDNVLDPLYNGKLYINTNSLALVKADFSMNLSNQSEVLKLLVKSKPDNVRIKAKNIDYTIDYREKNGKWYYGYSKANLSFEVKKRRRLFKSIYTLTCEMAVTDWELFDNTQDWTSKNTMSASIIMSDEASGFSDPTFWGEYNVIEPEKSIESAIRKIQRRLRNEEGKTEASVGKKP
ncbi:carboxypeptidase-like regulatory domain-containing protein [uncultured Dokdonia sp.]|uniref:carboxypeptidase-like regulatory domain-containing protein n=1 Tax=uncultured Dokdonia sp. TaxID=575653 RepID=UPI00262D707F|nr:carboxypeptidase-like regulatory domain-containing protein [uncultured Dokdonia sp.]